MGASFCLYCSNYILFTAAKFFLSFFLCFLSRIFSPFGTGILIISTMERTSVKESCYSFANPKATIVFNFFFFFNCFSLILPDSVITHLGSLTSTHISPQYNGLYFFFFLLPFVCSISSASCCFDLILCDFSVS